MSKTSAAILDNAARCVTLQSNALRPFARTNALPSFTRRQSAPRLRHSRLGASSGPEPSETTNPLADLNTDELLKDVQQKWDSVEDKTTLAVYVGGALLALFVGSSVVSAFDRIPLFPKLFQLVGLIYTSWFVYRYLLFKSSRQELISDVEELKNKISGEK